MHKLTLFILAAVFAVALAEGQYYVPRAYYTIDAEGHESARVPLRRLRRSVPWPYAAGSNANANAEAHAGPGGNANANARADAGGWGGNGDSWGQRGNNGGSWGQPGGWGQPGVYGASNPAAHANVLAPGMTRRQFGAVQGQSVSASTSVGVDPTGNGYYDQSASVH
ncbi:circumsporozoite protein isoform X1 [Helicoverpa armigera]|uniref:circumsporozoite protein isoform X1 n=1 Tax=Helicoverpa armigera TaxID=29058 RepID=UPI0030828436